MSKLNIHASEHFSKTKLDNNENLTISNSIVIEIEVVDVIDNGTGIGYYENKKVFIPYVFKGEVVRVELYDIKPNYAQARLIEIIESSPYRIESCCKNLCGACSYPTLDYQQELKQKQKGLVDLFNSNLREYLPKEISPEDIEILGMKEPSNYRNKAIYACEYRENKFISGLYESRSHRVVSIQNCCLEQQWMNSFRNEFVETINSELDKNINKFNEIDNSKLLEHIPNIRYLFMRGDDTSEKIVVIVLKHRDDCEYFEKIFGESLNLLCSKFSISNLLFHVNNLEGNRILDYNNGFTSLIGKEQITYELLGNKFLVTPHSFLQINKIQTTKLYKLAIELLSPAESENIVDLYCGMGSISLALAKKSKHVYGIECVETAISDAKLNAIYNDITNVDFYCGLVEDILPKLVQQTETPQIDGIMLDPARKGCESSVINTIIDQKIPRIVYVSCNPQTQVRDIKILLKSGYKLETIKAVDMFPRTIHIETVCHLSKNL